MTGTQGLGDDPEREKFEAEFPDITSEVPSAAVSPKDPLMAGRRGVDPRAVRVASQPPPAELNPS